MIITTTATVRHLPRAGSYLLDVEASTISLTTRRPIGFGRVPRSFPPGGGWIVVGESLTSSSVTVWGVLSPVHLDAAPDPMVIFAASRLRVAHGEAVLLGRLNVHGTAAPMRLRIDDLKTNGEDFVLSATGTVDRRGHGVTVGRALGGAKLHLQITARAQPA